jgi:hypothetical protein
MKGLVAYDSSSDEEADQDPVAPAQNSVHTPTALPQAENLPTDTQNDASVLGVEAAMVGPSMPAYAFEAPLMEDLNDLPSTMSEQDLVRHLTKASHTMQEIPPSPPGSPNPSTDIRLKRFLGLKATGLHFNEDLAKKNSFRNPALFSSLAERAGLDEREQYATSISPSLYGPPELPQTAFKEELARSQQSIRDQQAARKKQAAAAGRRTIDFTSASVSGTASQSSTPGSRQKSGS